MCRLPAVQPGAQQAAQSVQQHERVLMQPSFPDPNSVDAHAGARLTAFELVHDQLPATLICDSAAAALMAQNRVDAIVVGADRVAANGDTANKIGTYSLAVLAKHHG